MDISFHAKDLNPFISFFGNNLLPLQPKTTGI